MDEVVEPGLTIKAIGHQWYWSYEYSDYAPDALEFDSYMIPVGDLESGALRLLEVDHRLVVPIQTQVRVLVSGADVLHSFAVPSLSVKLDAIPGRLNQTNFFIKRPGVFYGQCSEICGANHSFMPIVVEAVSLEKYVQWVGLSSISGLVTHGRSNKFLICIKLVRVQSSQYASVRLCFFFGSILLGSRRILSSVPSSCFGGSACLSAAVRCPVQL